MARTKYKKKVKNGTTYYFYRLRHKNLRSPRDLYGKTVAELEEKIEKLKYELDRGVTSEKAYFGDYLENWLNNVHLINKKPATIKRYKGLYNNLFKGHPICNIRVGDLTALDIQDHYNRLVKQGASKAMLTNLTKIINPCVRYAFGQGKILIDFSHSITLPDAEKKKMEGTRRASQALLPDQEEKLLEVCKDTKWYYFILTALNTGMRRGELLALTWDDIDFEKRLIHVNKSYSDLGIVGSPKTDSSIRNIPIPQFLADELIKKKAEQAEIRLMIGNQYTNNNLVFENGFGQYIGNGAYVSAFKKFAKAIGVDRINVHDFRDTYATKLYNQTKDLKMIQTLLGHKDIKTTADVYTHVSDEETKKFIDNASIKANA